MIYRKMDANGDYTFGSNSSSYLSKKEAVAQAISTRLKLLIYEWWEDLEEGTPLWQSIISSRDIPEAVNIIRKRIIGTDHVKNLTFFDYNWDNTDTSEHCLLIGGYCDGGGTAGLFALYSTDGVGRSNPHFGSRLTYLPWAE